MFRDTWRALSPATRLWRKAVERPVVAPAGRQSGSTGCGRTLGLHGRDLCALKRLLRLGKVPPLDQAAFAWRGPAGCCGLRRGRRLAPAQQVDRVGHPGTCARGYRSARLHHPQPPRQAVQRQREGQVDVAAQHQVRPGLCPGPRGIRVTAQQIGCFAGLGHRQRLVHHHHAQLLRPGCGQQAGHPRNLCPGYLPMSVTPRTGGVDTHNEPVGRGRNGLQIGPENLGETRIGAGQP